MICYHYLWVFVWFVFSDISDAKQLRWSFFPFFFGLCNNYFIWIKEWGWWKKRIKVIKWLKIWKADWFNQYYIQFPLLSSVLMLFFVCFSIGNISSEGKKKRNIFLSFSHSFIIINFVWAIRRCIVRFWRGGKKQ